MKKNLFIFLVLFISTSISVSTTSCSKQCELALADLVTELAFQGIVKITAGTPFNIPNAIANAKNTVEACKGDILETISAGKSKSRIQVDFDKSLNGSFGNNKVSNNFDVPEIPAGMKAVEDYQFSFNEPGDYRIITFADDKLNVTERDEKNNSSPTKTVKSASVADAATDIDNGRLALVVRVLPNPNYTRKIDEPFVQILSRTVKIVKQ